MNIFGSDIFLKKTMKLRKKADGEKASLMTDFNKLERNCNREKTPTVYRSIFVLVFLNMRDTSR